MATLTDDVKMMHLCFLLVAIPTELGVKIRVKGESLTFEQLQSELDAENPEHPFPEGLFGANKATIAKFLGSSAEAKAHRQALGVIQKHFREMGDEHDLHWTPEPCPRDRERTELQAHLLRVG